jgi:hypothetical protein
MAQYKILQDIEAEDKLVGPLTLRQFIYAIVVAVSLFIGFRFLFAAPWLLAIMTPHIVLFSILAAPFGHDQAGEVWLLAKIQFMVKPRKRIWDQSGLKQVVEVRAPRTVEKQLTKSHTQAEVKSHLKALAETIDSRGWAVKNSASYPYQNYATDHSLWSDRLVEVQAIPNQVAQYDIEDDMFDQANNQTAQKFSSMLNKSSEEHKQKVIQMMHQPQEVQAAPETQAPPAQAPPISAPNDNWFLSPTQDDSSAAQGTQTAQITGVRAPMQTNDQVQSQAPQDQSQQTQPADNQPPANNDSNYQQQTTITPIDYSQQEDQNNQTAGEQTDQSTDKSTRNITPDTDILNLAHNDDLNVATIARQADKAHQKYSSDEVVISLH